MKRIMIFSLISMIFTTATWGIDRMENEKKINALIEDFPTKLKNAPTINVDTLKKWQSEKKIILIDVRKEKEMNVSIIEGAISEDEYMNNQEKYKEYTPVVYCTIGYRSAQFVNKLSKKGTSSYNLQGSILSWVNSGGKVVNSSGETKEVHVYGKQWDILPEDYKGIW